MTRLTSEKQVVVCAARSRQTGALGTPACGALTGVRRTAEPGGAPRRAGQPGACRAFAHLANRGAGADGSRAAAQRRRRRAHDASVHGGGKGSHGKGRGRFFGRRPTGARAQTRGAVRARQREQKRKHSRLWRERAGSQGSQLRSWAGAGREREVARRRAAPPPRLAAPRARARREAERRPETRSRTKRMSASDAYDILGVAPDATPAQVRQAYHRAVRAHMLALRPRPLRGADGRRGAGAARAPGPRQRARRRCGFRARAERLGVAAGALRCSSRRRARTSTPDAPVPQDTSARARYDTLSKPHAVRRRATRAKTPLAAPHAPCYRRRPAKTSTLTTCVRCRTGRVRPTSSVVCTLLSLSACVSGAFRFEHPCRCGDRFTVAEAVRSAVLLFQSTRWLSPRCVVELARRRRQPSGPVLVRRALGACADAR
jgi:hypothetical protein